MFLNTRNYDAAATEGTGGTPPSDTEAKEFETLSAKVETELTPEEKTKLEGLKGKYNYQAVGSDGKPLTTEQVNAIKEVQTKVDAILAKTEDQRTPEELKYLEDNTEEETPEKGIYELVDELKGEVVSVDYGDVKPDSPEGIVLRENAIADKVAQEIQANIQSKYPQAFRLMQHLAKGGKEEDFYKPENKDFLSVKLTKEDKEAQEQVLRTALSMKGNSPEIIDAVVTAVKDKATLFETANKELEALQNNQKVRGLQEQQLQQQQQLQEQQAVDTFIDTLETKVEKGFDGVIVPVADRQKFAKFFAERSNYENGEFIYRRRIDPAQIDKELKIAYFEFKGGDLKGLAERTAATQRAIKLKQQIKHQVVPKTGGGSAIKHVPMGSV